MLLHLKPELVGARLVGWEKAFEANMKVRTGIFCLMLSGALLAGQANSPLGLPQGNIPSPPDATVRRMLRHQRREREELAQKKMRASAAQLVQLSAKLQQEAEQLQSATKRRERQALLLVMRKDAKKAQKLAHQIAEAEADER